MFILKNAFKNIRRSKGRSILFGIIVFIIALSACLSLSIREAANTARDSTLEDLQVTANISVDRESLMKNAEGTNGQPPDQDSMKEAMSGKDELSLTELQKYAKCDSVKDFYYTMSLSVNGNSKLKAVESSSGNDSNKKNMPENAMSTGDFTLTGYSSDEAMTDFIDGNSSISKGSVFKEGTDDATCVVNSELATYNDLSVGDSITVVNADDSSAKTKLKIVGIYKVTSSDSETAGAGPGGMMGGSDPANSIYTSYETLKTVAKTLDATGRTSGTYTFASVDDYEKFEDQAREAGLGDDYTVSSRDIEQYEQSLLPLTNLSKYATYFLIIMLVIGAAILVVLSLFNVRERKYEIGVLAAIGMSKKKIARQFIYELVIVTFIALSVGTIAGSATSVPITNSLLSNQITAEQENTDNQQQQFGRPPGGMGGPGSESGSSSSDTAKDSKGGMSANTVTSVSSAADFKVIIELLGVGILLTLIASGAAVSTVMRYDPLRILSDRD